MLRRKALVRTEFSEELSASIIGVTRIGNSSPILVTLMIETLRSVETSGSYKSYTA
jgi:hypothetical protein